jgi:hypothetical protein
LSFEGSHCFLERFDSGHDDMLEGFLGISMMSNLSRSVPRTYLVDRHLNGDGHEITDVIP